MQRRRRVVRQAAEHFGRGAFILTGTADLSEGNERTR
jgi:hypothetical protein